VDRHRSAGSRFHRSSRAEKIKEIYSKDFASYIEDHIGKAPEDATMKPRGYTGTSVLGDCEVMER